MIPINPIGLLGVSGPFVQFARVEAKFPHYFYCEFAINGTGDGDDVHYYKLTASKGELGLVLNTDIESSIPEIEIQNVDGEEFERRFEEIMKVKLGIFQLLALAFKQGLEYAQSQSRA